MSASLKKIWKLSLNIDSLHPAVSALLFIGSFVILIKGADLLVDHGSLIAKKLGVSDLVIGLTIIALGTSAPEFAVSSIAALEGYGSLSLGNVIGSNIFNLGFILAICAIAKPMHVSRELFYRDGMVLLAGSTVLTIMCITGYHISRWEGFILLTGLVAYLAYLLRSQMTAKAATATPQPPATPEEGDQEGTAAADHSLKTSLAKSLSICLLGLLMLLSGSRLLVDLATGVARNFGMSEWMIGVTIIAVGTSLPELVTAVASIAKGKQDIGLGNLIGSDIFNIVGVMGFSAALRPIDVETAITTPLYLFLATIVALIIFMRVGWRLSRLEGALLLLVASSRWIYGFLHGAN